MVELSGSKPSGMMEIIRNEETGEISGVTLPSGKSFVGLSPRDIRNLIKAQQGKEAELGGTVEARDVAAAREQDIRAQELAQVPIETARNIPILNPPAQGGGIPLVSETGQAGELAAQTAQQTNLIRKIRAGTATSDEIRIATRRFQLDEIDMEVIKAGQADISKTGQFVEAIPFLPRELKRFIPVFSTPSKKVNEIKDNLEKIKENIVLWSDLAKSNPRNASQYVSLIEQAEHEVLRMESRIKLLSIQSPDLQANPEQVNSIETSITTIKTNIQAKRNELILLGIR